MSHILARDVVDQSVINTTTETRLFAHVIEPGVWPGNVLLVEQTGRYRNNNQNTRNYRIRLRLNGQQMFTAQAPSPTASTLYFAAAQRWLLAAVGTNRVDGIMLYACGGPGTDTGNFVLPEAPGGGGLNIYGGVNVQTSEPTYVDLTKPVGLEITVQMNNTGANHEFHSMGVWVCFLGDGLKGSVGADFSNHPKRRAS